MNGPKNQNRAVTSVLLALLAWPTSVLTMLLLLFAYLIPQDLAKTTEPYATLVAVSFFVRVVTFHIGLLLALVTLIAIVIQRRRLMFVAGGAGLIALAPALLSYIPHKPGKPIGPTLRVMSMNLKRIVPGSTGFAPQVQALRPDVVVLVDYLAATKMYSDHSFGKEYRYRYVGSGNQWSLAIYSRLPFDHGHPNALVTQANQVVRVVLKFRGDLIAFYVEHPVSPRSKHRVIVNRLQTAELCRQLQVEKLPAVVAGDFNFTETTPNETALKSAGLKDTFDLAGIGRGSTWPVDPTWMQWLPGVRIDHIFVTPQLTCSAFSVGKYDGSDHLPIVADIGFAANP